MKKIAVLDQHTIDKIAAGEVVERPSSVVKELVENAIDAGATAVTVEVAEGGKKLIRITDNGSGMEADQVPLAFLRHATSKIEKVEDLEQIASLGFRGEALSSIAAVSQVELITKTPSAISGIRYRIEGGRELDIEELGAPEGTTFLVRNLFYNTPARSKFLKSDMTEANYIGALMEQLALSHPEIAFKYIQNKQVKLHTSGNCQVRDVIYHIYGREITKSLLEISFENEFMKISGYAGKPEISRGNRTFENYSVNGRYVKNTIITKAIEDAYKGFLMQHKFPFISLQIEMNGNDLDVNVHPRKMEVRFARGPQVYEAIYQTIRLALARKEMIPQVSVGSSDTAPVKREALKPSAIPEPFESKRREAFYQHPAVPLAVKPVPKPGSPSWNPAVQTDQIREEEPTYLSHTPPLSREEESLFQGTLRENQEEKEKTDKLQKTPILMETSTSSEKTVSQKKVPQEEPKRQELSAPEGTPDQTKFSASEEPKQLELFEEKLLSPKSRSRHQLIGQLFDTYWLVQFEENFYIIDQHAAHEKVYYERLVKQLKEKELVSQYLSPPLIVTLSRQEESVLKANQKYFQDFGFEIEPFGGKDYAISAVPADLYGAAEETLFLDLLDHLSLEGEKNGMQLFTSRLATMACKAAVKGNHQMSAREADSLIDELLTLENPYHCPHGRPTIISMSKSELEKKFKRIV